MRSRAALLAGGIAIGLAFGYALFALREQAPRPGPPQAQPVSPAPVFIPVSATRSDGTWTSALALLPSQEPEVRRQAKIARLMARLQATP